MCFCIRGCECLSVGISVFLHVYFCVCWAFYISWLFIPRMYLCVHTWSLWLHVSVSTCMFSLCSIQAGGSLCVYLCFACLYTHLYSCVYMCVCQCVRWLTTMRKCVYGHPWLLANLLNKLQRVSIYLLLELLCYALQLHFHLIKWVKKFFLRVWKLPSGTLLLRILQSVVAVTEVKRQPLLSFVMFKINQGSKAPWVRMSTESLCFSE